MNVDPGGDWRRFDYAGWMDDFNLKPPLVAFEHRERDTRVLAKPLVPIVPEAESSITVEAVAERCSSVSAHQGEYVQTHWYRATQEAMVPVVFPDAPLSAERFDELEWRIAVQPVETEPAERDEDFRPDRVLGTFVEIDEPGRDAARETLETFLAIEPRFRTDLGSP